MKPINTKPLPLILALYFVIVTTALIAVGVKRMSLEAEWMPVDHTGQDVTDEATAEWILKHGEQE